MRAEILAPDLTAGIAVDVAALVFRAGCVDRPAQDRVEVLLTAWAGGWALPGALVRVDESFEDAARRAVRGKAGYEPAGWYLDQLATFGAVDRDTRGRVVSVGHLALARAADLRAVQGFGEPRALGLGGTTDLGGTNGPAGTWCPLSRLPWDDLLWDHPTILRTAISRLRSKLRYSWVAFELLPNPFAVSDLRDLYAAFYGDRVAKLSTTNFMKAFRSLLDSGELVPVGEVERSGRRGRPPARYRFSGEPSGTRDRELPW